MTKHDMATLVDELRAALSDSEACRKEYEEYSTKGDALLRAFTRSQERVWRAEKALADHLKAAS